MCVWVSAVVYTIFLLSQQIEFLLFQGPLSPKQYIAAQGQSWYIF